MVEVETARHPRVPVAQSASVRLGGASLVLERFELLRNPKHHLNANHNEPVGRKLREGVDIVLGNQTILLKSREEFLQGAVPTTRTQRGFG